MPAVIVNTVTVLAGSLIGILFRNRLKESLRNAVMKALGLCTLLIGVSSAIATQNLLCVIVCMAVGTVLGELMRIDDGIEHAGDAIKSRLLKGRAREDDLGNFTEGCIIFAKSTLDFVSSMAFGAAMGFGVTCSAAFVFIFQGALTLLAGVLGSALPDAAVTEMSAVGGVILMGMALNMLDCTRERIRVANMLPAIFLPILWTAIASIVK